MRKLAYAWDAVKEQDTLFATDGNFTCEKINETLNPVTSLL